jgi:hypothetical protein
MVAGVIEGFLKATNGKFDRVVELDDGCELYIRPDFVWYPCLIKQNITYIGDGSVIILDRNHLISFKR